jgi:8-oxo-dGTP pyrophosphatase MutT (NUDIX family)
MGSPYASRITSRTVEKDPLSTPDGELADGPPVVPRPAATVILLRGGSESLEVMLVQRAHEARFMGGAWVFPGGAVDPHEGTGEASLRAAAVREVEEEASVTLPDADALVTYSRWITPAVVKIRFDTWFFLAPLPDGAEPKVDGHECIDLRWETPTSALEAWKAGDIQLVFPTIKHLEQISTFESADALIEHATGRDVLPVEPRIELEGEIARVLLPGEPGYDDA